MQNGLQNTRDSFALLNAAQLDIHHLTKKTKFVTCCVPYWKESTIKAKNLLPWEQILYF